MIPVDFQLASYDFPLPEEQIAQVPATQRDASKLLVLDRARGRLETGIFTDILRHLPENCLLVANNSKVVPARITGRRASGGRVEFLLLTPPPLLKAKTLPGGRQEARGEGLLRSSKQVKPGEVVELAPGFTLVLEERGDFGRCQVLLAWRGDLLEILRVHGSLPLPPYIRREAGQEDAARYQTCYADDSKAGSVAAPTAGLHFTPDLHRALVASGREWAETTLYVGYGTFSPVRAADIREHCMHAEYVEVPPETAAAVNRAKAEGRPVVAVGTTAARALEGAFAAAGRTASGGKPELQPFSGWTDIFIYPQGPVDFRVVDSLITNFHLPGSSLLMLVSAFAGREEILRAYQAALDRNFRFFSYGDAMLIL